MPAPKVPYTKTDPARVSYVPAKGIYKRTEGLCSVAESGTVRLVYKTFYLGSDEAMARQKALLIHQLWQEVQAKGQEAWTLDTLELADAIRKGDYTSIRNANLVTRVFTYPADHPDAYLTEAVDGNRLPTTSEGGGPRLYQAIDDFAAWARSTFKTKTERIEDSTTTEYGEKLALAVERFKDAILDMPVSGFNYAAVELLANHYKARPYRKGTTKRIAPDTVRHSLLALSRFIKWLRKNPKYAWRRPEDVADALKFNRAKLLTDEEIADLKNGVPTFSLPELTTIWKYATQWEKVFVILGLNGAFAESECGSLRMNEIHFNNDPPAVIRIRRKTKVYGEFALWPETIDCLRWLLSKRKTESCVKDSAFLIVSENGKPLTRIRIANMWNRLIRRIHQDDPAFKRLSFKFLRKTSGQFVQDFSDGETAGVFMCRGQRVKTDDQIDRYTNRDFGKVFKANAAVRKFLQPMFDAAPNPFSGDKLQGGGNISLGTIERIKRLHMDGMKPVEIAKTVGVSRATVYRHI